MTKSKKRPTIQSKQSSPNVVYNILETSVVPPKRRHKLKITSKMTEKSSITDTSENYQPLTNIILHLKCGLNDLNANNEILNSSSDPHEYNPTLPPQIEIKTFSTQEQYAIYDQQHKCGDVEDVGDIAYHTRTTMSLTTLNSPTDCSNVTIQPLKEPDDMKDINVKLKALKINLYKNNLGDKKSACFWCTYPFDNETCYIPKYSSEETMHGYGSFCRPECAAAYLLKENIDDSTKFERYHLLNQVYGKVYDYKRNIKPAPNPYYLLENYYGTLTIQECRLLLQSKHLLCVLEKPLTRILPELHEDNEQAVSKQGNSSSKQFGMYKVKRQSDKSQPTNKSNILREHFGL